MASLSSDSELDEFYDAEDVTPSRSILENMALEDDDEVTAEERKLLELQRQQEERRKKEDRELKMRLEALRMKKHGHRKKNEDIDKNDEMEKRRKKHEEMRRKMTEKGDHPDSSESSSDSELDEVDSNARLSRKITEAESDVTSQEVVNNAVTDQNDKYDEYSLNINSSHPEKEKLNKQLHDLVEDKPRSSTESSESSTIEHNFDVQNLIENVIQESQLLSDDNGVNEPDIVRSTKTRTPPSTLQGTSNNLPQTVILTPPSGRPVSLDADTFTGASKDTTLFVEPVAPPRRKKKSKSSLQDGSDNQGGSQRSSASSLQTFDGLSNAGPQSPGLPPERNPLQLDLEHIRDEEEHSLDLNIVIRSGKRHIKSQEAEILAVNSDHDSPRDTLDNLQTVSDSKVSKSSSLDRDGKISSGSSLEREGKRSKGSSLEQESKSSKGSSLEKESKKSKNSSLDRHSKSSSNVDKSERRRSRNTSGHDSLPRKGSMNRHQSTSGPPLTDEEILMSTMVKNLDTGEMVPLKDADQKLPKCIDPLILHIMERTNDYPSDDSNEKDEMRSESSLAISAAGVRKKGAKLKKLFGRKMGKTVSKVKSVADQVMHSEESSTIVEGEISEDGRRFKFKANHNKKGPYDFGQLKAEQDLSGEHTGAVWCMQFSPCGRLLASGGQDGVLRIWVLDSAFNYFDDMRQKYVEMKVSSAESQESLSSIPSVSSSDVSSLDLGATAETFEDKKGPFRTKPFCKYRGHSADLLDISWSKNYFILSSSMDKTVRLWHISRRECLCTFQHVDFVTSIVFHPRDDRYFLSGSLDGKLRLWNIPDKRVTMWNEVGGGSLITTANFCHNGKFAVVGTYDGKCVFYNTEHLKYYTQIHVRSTRGKNSRGRKITGIEPLPGEDKVLVTSNDSRVRLYDLRDLTLTCKYKGPTNNSSQIRAGFSNKGKYIVCGSEDHFVYLWRTQHEFYKFSSARRDRNDYYEAFKVHNTGVTAAVLAPNSNHFLNGEDSKKSKDASSTESKAEFVISADLMGTIKVVRVK
ncbi:WD repeat-containing protein 44 [Mactra antiquata]